MYLDIEKQRINKMLLTAKGILNEKDRPARDLSFLTVNLQPAFRRYCLNVQIELIDTRKH